MPSVSVALASINPTVGDIAGNAQLVVKQARLAVAAGCRLIVFPEMALTGYPVEDLALRSSFRAASVAAVNDLARHLADEGCGEATVVVGFLGERMSGGDPSEDVQPPGPRPTNSAAVIHHGQVVLRYDKHRLPNYGVFDEERWFAPGHGPCIFHVNGLQAGVVICEDLWQEDGWLVDAAAESDILIAINASPFEIGKQARREALCRRRADQLGCLIAYVNIVGGQDELVFDGGAIVAEPGDRLLVRSPRFEAGLVMFDATTGAHRPIACRPRNPSQVVDHPGDLAECLAAITLGLRDYARKNGLNQVLVGLSGGIDSAVVATLACDALGPENVLGVAMPSRYSSAHSLSDARDLATRTGLSFRTVPIEPMFTSFQGELDLSGLAEENLQARIRGCILMAISNAEGRLVLATGNKSEIAVGYSTIYGDAVGGFAPIKDVPKTIVRGIANYRNEIALANGQMPPIPEHSITKPPSAELRPGQLDVDSLPDYGTLDAVLESYVEHGTSGPELVSAGFDPEVVRKVLSLTDRAEYKRRQYPPGPKITALAFGRDRRLPITNHWAERLS